ncbi:MAG: RNA polymerase sigma factor [Pirellula sp.]
MSEPHPITHPTCLSGKPENHLQKAAKERAGSTSLKENVNHPPHSGRSLNLWESGDFLTATDCHVGIYTKKREIFGFARRCTMSESTDEIGLLVDAPTDRELLKRFLIGDDAAFAQLIERHAELVRGVCFRVLRNTTDCEDAFQATFFILASQAKDQAWQDSIGGWLHQVARRVSLRLRADIARRKHHEKQSCKEQPQTDNDPVQQIGIRELGEILDAELAKLPVQFREVIVLTQIEGLSRLEAASRLGITVSAVKDRLERGREILQRRITMRGVTITSVTIAAWMVPGSAQAAGLATLVSNTTTAAIAFSGGKMIGTQLSVASGLAQAILKVTGLQKVAVAVALLLSLITGGTVAYGFLQDNPRRFDLGLRGHIVRIDHGSQPSLTIELDEYQALLNLDIASQAKIWIAFEAASIDSLKKGQFVAVQLDVDNRTSKEIHAQGQIREATIRAIGEGDTLIVEGDDDVESPEPGKLLLSPEAIVRIGGMPASRDELRPGMSIPVEFNKNGEIVHAIEVEGESDQFIYGELLSIDTQRNKLTLFIDDETEIPKQRDFELDSSVVVVAKGVKVNILELSKGSMLKLRLSQGKLIVKSIRVETVPETSEPKEEESP